VPARDPRDAGDPGSEALDPFRSILGASFVLS
jgi:hypothetical protein